MPSQALRAETRSCRNTARRTGRWPSRPRWAPMSCCCSSSPAPKPSPGSSTSSSSCSPNRPRDIAFDQILGQKRHRHASRCRTAPRGISTASSTGSARASGVPSAMGNAFFTRYQAEMVPQLWLLTRKSQSRTFQHDRRPRHPQEGAHRPRRRLSAPGHLPAARLLRPVPRDRLRLRQPAHGGGGHLSTSSSTPTAGHQMVVADTPQSHADVPGADHRHLRSESKGGSAQEDRVQAWEKSQEIRSGQVHALGPLLRAARARTSRPSSRPSTRCRPAPSPTSSRSPATTSWSSTTTPAATPSGSTASPPAAATGPATSRTSSRTTPAPPRSGCSRRRRPRSRSRARAPAGSSPPGTSSRSSGTSTPMAPTS